MQSPSLAVRPLTDPKANSSENRSLTAHRPRDVQHRHMTRRVEIQALLPNGEIRDFTGLAPARPTLFQTDNGLVAVEDLLPGDVIHTADRGVMTLIWKGCTTLAPSMHDASTGGPLTRIHAESYGVGRPMPDLLLGPAARVMQRTPDLAASIGTDKALTPAASLVDGMNAISVSTISPERV